MEVKQDAQPEAEVSNERKQCNVFITFLLASNSKASDNRRMSIAKED